MDTIYKRRSIRKYTSEPVDHSQLKELIKAGMNAPSANNQQPWHFVIIDSRKLLDAIPEFHAYSQMLKAAPAAILVCGDLTIDTADMYWVQDCSEATENILLEIADRDLGGVWLGVYPRVDRVEETRNILGLPEHIVGLWTERARPILFKSSYSDDELSRTARITEGIALLGLPLLLIFLLQRKDGRSIYLLYAPLFLLLYAWIGRTEAWYFPSFVTFSCLLLFSGCAFSLDWIARKTKVQKWSLKSKTTPHRQHTERHRSRRCRYRRRRLR